MKKVFLAVATLFVMSVAMSSCKKECVDCGSATGYSGEICKDDYEEVGGVTWETYKAALKAAGCK